MKLVIFYGRKFMFIKIFKLLISFCLVFILISCAKYLYKNNTSLVLFETTYSQFKDDSGYLSKNEVFSLENDLNNYRIVEKNISHAAGALSYIYAFQNDTLIYFGYPYQFSQSPNEKINNLGKYYNTKMR